jgi:hypothetical protein
VRIDEAGHDRAAGDVDDARARGHLDLPRAPTADDAVVADDDVGVLDDLVAAHGDRAAAAQHAVPSGMSRVRGDRDARLLGLVSRRRACAAPRDGACRAAAVESVAAVSRAAVSHASPRARVQPRRCRRTPSRAQVVDDVRIADRPVHLRPSAFHAGNWPPMSVSLRAGNCRLAPDGDGRVVAADHGHRHDVHVVVDLRERLVAGRGHAHDATRCRRRHRPEAAGPVTRTCRARRCRPSASSPGARARERRCARACRCGSAAR